jgi:hypothetical protein
MIKNKEILQEIEEKEKEISCDNCVHCNTKAFHSGKWYCNKISVFETANIDECFERRR